MCIGRIPRRRMPQYLINAKLGGGCGARIFRRQHFPSSSRMDEWAVGDHPDKCAGFRRWVWRSTRARGFEVGQEHLTHYGRTCLIEMLEGLIGNHQFRLRHLCAVKKYGFVSADRKVKDGRVTDEAIYLSAMEEGRYTVAQANSAIDPKGRFTDDLVVVRHAGDVQLIPPDKVDFMDVSPKQLVSLAAALIPFLENDEATRALMGSNMQRQAVPTLRPDAPLVKTGLEKRTARNSGAVDHRPAQRHRRSGGGTRIVPPHRRDDRPSPRVDIYRLINFQRSNQHTCIDPASHSSRRPPHPARAQASPTVPRTDLGELALGHNALVAFMPWDGYNFEDSILLRERLVRRRRLHLHPHRGVRHQGPRHQARAGGDHARHPQRRRRRSCSNPRRGRDRGVGAEVRAERHPGRQGHAKGAAR